MRLVFAMLNLLSVNLEFCRHVSSALEGELFAARAIQIDPAAASVGGGYALSFIIKKTLRKIIRRGEKTTKNGVVAATSTATRRAGKHRLRRTLGKAQRVVRRPKHGRVQKRPIWPG